MKDMLTVMWKEWHETMQSGGNRRSTVWSIAVALLVVAVIFPLQSGREWVEGGAVVIWAVAPLVLLPQVIADAFAGERERHTLETLLASRLPDQAILFGKIATPLAWAWGIVQFAMLAALVTVNVAFGEGELLLYDARTILLGLLLSFLVGLFIAGAGVLISLRASTVRQAQQMIGLVTLALFFLPMGFVIVVPALPESFTASIKGVVESGNCLPFVVVLTLVLVDGMLLALAVARFRRSHLILD